ncbi:hypothetical protein Tco_1440692 [Tanacetum coccineum]
MVVAGGDSGVLEWWLWRVVARRWSGGGGWVVRRLVVGSNDGGGVGSGGWRWCRGDGCGGEAPFCGVTETKRTLLVVAGWGW